MTFSAFTRRKYRNRKYINNKIHAKAAAENF